MKRAFVLVALLTVFSVSGFTEPQKTSGLQWQGWSQSVFDQARSEHKFVLLDLEAVWCHWCHVMDETTYKDPAVIRLLQSKYLLVKVDQDKRPDLSNRYEDFGWPATVVFAADGSEIVKRRGYLLPEEMSSMLQAVIDDPTPGPSVEPEEKIVYPTKAGLTPALREELTKGFLNGYDKVHGSWGFNQKYLDWDSVEYSLDLARTGDKGAEQMARQTLHEQLHLLDPAWGGVYQYSTDGDWKAPHFEKIMQFQAENLRIYSLASAQLGDPEDLHAASEIHRFVTTFLMSPEGAFYTSQDADLVEGKHSAEYFALSDAERRKLGVPRVDKHIYARENGWMIAAIATFYGATGDKKYLDEATRAANWVIKNRALPGGGFRHDAQNAAGPFLGDTIAMGRGFLALYSVTGDRAWLQRATAASDFIERNFKNSQGAGFTTAHSATDHAYVPHPQRDENVMVVRFANLLSHYTGNEHYREMAEFSMRYLAAEPIAERTPIASVLLAERELSSPPLHLTIVGGKSDPKAQELFAAALRYPANYKRLEWWDVKEGKLPNPDVEYPQLSRAAAFVCTSRTCSPPIFEPVSLSSKVDRLVGVTVAEVKK
ncbi:MAG TPA: DUF255 domain-containing protein [Candidatus Acidoferrales bacterium]|nr:DUF255 domain-containing protein [Candidatus Acidoferrales bacterium]